MPSRSEHGSWSHRGKQWLGETLDHEPPVVLTDLRPEDGARVAEARSDPTGVLALGKPSVAVVELQRNRLEASRIRHVESDEEQQPEVVAEERIDCVVVEEVAEVVEHAS